KGRSRHTRSATRTAWGMKGMWTSRAACVRDGGPIGAELQGRTRPPRLTPGELGLAFLEKCPERLLGVLAGDVDRLGHALRLERFGETARERLIQQALAHRERERGSGRES